MSEKEEPKKEAKTEKNAATRFGLEDHEATQQDARVTTLRVDHERRASMQTPDRRNPKSTSRLMSVNDQWAIPRGPGTEAASEPEDPKAPAKRESSTSETHRETDEPKRQSYDAESSETDGGEKRDSQWKRASSVGSPIGIPEQGTQLRLAEPQAAPEAHPPSTPPETVDRQVETDQPPARPEDTPLPPPTMISQAPLSRAVSVDDVQSTISKMTNTDVTINPSKRFATKATNTSGMLLSESDSEADMDTQLPDEFPATDLDKLFLLACQEVRSAGEIALALNENKNEEANKSQEQPEQPEQPTSTDNEVEESFVKAISSRYPDHKFVSSERVCKCEPGMVELTDSPTWIIDPIDGAMNYVHHFPYYCISVAYLVNKQTEFGIIYNPPMKNMYSAQRQKGAKMNGKAIKVTGQAKLSSALVLQEFGAGNNDKNGRLGMENAQRLTKHAHAMRSIGSSAMGLAMVASGVADAYYNFGLHVWHMAAGVLLVTEAGGVAMDPAGGEVDLMSRRILAASSNQLASEVGSHLDQSYPSPRDDQSGCHNPSPEMKDFTSQTDFPDSEESSETEAARPQ